MDEHLIRSGGNAMDVTSQETPGMMFGVDGDQDLW